MRLALILLSILWLSIANGQSSNDKPGLDYFASPALGFGMIYGGLGGNLELGYGHFSGYGAFGYAPSNRNGTVRINSSLNFQGGLRYYFDVGSDLIFPRVGLGFGWITNYYDARIGTATYDQSVNGLSLHTGVQIYSEEGIIFNFDIVVASSIAISTPEKHPYFFPFYIRPCIGVGYDISRVFNKDKTRRIKNKTISPFG